jgi:hypothetical protein
MKRWWTRSSGSARRRRRSSGEKGVSMEGGEIVDGYSLRNENMRKRIRKER